MSTRSYTVTYWHTGDDGTHREPGETVTLDPDGDEVRRRVQDGFIRLTAEVKAEKAKAEKAEQKADAKASEK